MRAPAARFSAVCPTEPPTGCPLNRPLAMLPMPWATKSPLTLDGAPSAFGATSRTPAPCTSTITAIASAPTTRSNESWSSAGSAGSGRPLGISPMSSTRCTHVVPGHDQHGCGNDEREERPEPTQRRARRDQQQRQRTNSGQGRRPLDRTQLRHDVERLRDRGVTLRRDAEQLRQLAEDDVGRHAGEEPGHHRVRHKARIAPQPQQAGRDHHGAREDREQEERLRTLRGIDLVDRRPRCERGGARRRDDHALGARAQTARDRANEARVEAVDRIDAGEHAGGHPVRHAADGAGDPRDRVRFRGAPVRRAGAEPAQRGHYDRASVDRGDDTCWVARSATSSGSASSPAWASLRRDCASRTHRVELPSSRASSSAILPSCCASAQSSTAMNCPSTYVRQRSRPEMLNGDRAHGRRRHFAPERARLIEIEDAPERGPAQRDKTAIDLVGHDDASLLSRLRTHL